VTDGLQISVATAAKKLRAGRCLTPFCRRKARQQRHFCCTCQDRKWRERNPLRYLLKNLRGHATARGITFTITYEQWVEFCLRTGYADKVGREPNSATVDRIDPRFGYHCDNIRVLTHAMNSERQDALPPAHERPYEAPLARCG
jgi:hypothetical protein